MVTDKAPERIWPEQIEGHLGPRGGMMFVEPGYPGTVYHRYVRDDRIKELEAERDALRAEIKRAALRLEFCAGFITEVGTRDMVGAWANETLAALKDKT